MPARSATVTATEPRAARTEAARAGATARRATHIRAAVAAAGGQIVVTDHDAGTITLVAATLTSLSQRHRRVDAARVVVAGARQHPAVGHQPTAEGQILPAVCSAHTGPVVLTPDPPRDVPLVLPGLVHTLGVFPVHPSRDRATPRRTTATEETLHDPAPRHSRRDDGHRGRADPPP